MGQANQVQSKPKHINKATNPLRIIQDQLPSVRSVMHVHLEYHRHTVGYIEVDPQHKETVYETNTLLATWRVDVPENGDWYYAARVGHDELISLYRPTYQIRIDDEMSLYRFLEDAIPVPIRNELNLARKTYHISSTPSFITTEDLEIKNGPTGWTKPQHKVHVNLTGTPLQLLAIPVDTPEDQMEIKFANFTGKLVNMVQEDDEVILSRVITLPEGVMHPDDLDGSWYLAKTAGQQGKLLSLFKLDDRPRMLFKFLENLTPPHVRKELVFQRGARGMNLQINLAPSPGVATLGHRQATDTDGFSNGEHEWLALRAPRIEMAQDRRENGVNLKLLGSVEFQSGLFDAYTAPGFPFPDIHGGVRQFYKATRGSELMVLYQDNPWGIFIRPPEDKLPNRLQQEMSKHRQDAANL